MRCLTQPARRFCSYLKIVFQGQRGPRGNPDSVDFYFGDRHEITRASGQSLRDLIFLTCIFMFLQSAPETQSAHE